MKKILIILGSLIILIFLALLILPFIFKDEIKQKIKDEINKELLAKVDFSNVNLSFIRSFPNASVGVDSLSIVGINSFKKDTLVAAKRISVSADIWSVIFGDKIKINGIEIDEVKVKAKKLRTGEANWEITKPDVDTTKVEEPANYSIGLKKFTIKNSSVVFDDQQLGFFTSLENLNTTIKGDFTQDKTDISADISAKNVQLRYGGISYLSKADVSYKGDINADLKNSIYGFKQNELKVNALQLLADGSVALKENGDMPLDVSFKAPETELKQLISLIPAYYTNDFDKLKTSGSFALDGKVKGTYNETQLPGFDMNLKVNNGSVKYPDLPSSVEKINIDVNAQNKGTTADGVEVFVKNFSAELAKQPFQAQMTLKTPVSNPYIDLFAKGKINLNEIKNFIPQKESVSGGILDIDLALKGFVNQLQSGNYSAFDAKGYIIGSQIQLKNPEIKYPISIPTAHLNFSPQYIDVPNLVAKIGQSDMQFKGKVSNYMAYIFKGEKLTGTLDFNSNTLNINQFMSDAPAKAPTSPKDTAPLQTPALPSNIDFTLNTNINQLYYDNLSIQNIKGRTQLKEAQLHMENLSMNLMGGSLLMSGIYNTLNTKAPWVDMNLDIQNFDISQTFNYFKTVQWLAPIAKLATGTFSTKFGMKSTFDDHMNPDYSSIFMNGLFNSNSLVINGSETLKTIDQLLNINKFSSFDLSKINLGFKVENGTIKVNPFEKMLGTTKLTIGGTHNLKNEINYGIDIAIPRKELGTKANNLVNDLYAKATKAGLNLNPASEIVNLKALITGTLTKPKVQLNLKEMAAATLNNLVDAGKEKVNNLVDQQVQKLNAEAQKIISDANARAQAIVAAARQQADQIRQAAQQQADQIRATSDAEIQKIEERGNSNPLQKLAMQKLADQTRKERDRKIQKILDEANARADGIVNTAQQQADRINQEAKEKADALSNKTPKL